MQAVADHAAALANRDIPAQHVDVQPPDLNAGRRDVQEVAGVRVDQVELSDWLYPEVPLAHPGMVADDAEGWNLIDRWDVWDCVLSEFPTMQDIPRAYREVWAAAVAKVLRNIQAVDDGLELERGLKWFLILPKAVFRQARRGGKAGRGQITRRVNCLIRGDWGGLLALLERDCQLSKRERRRARRGENPAAELENKRRNALLLLAKGHISKAAQRINSNGIADMDNPDVQDEMRLKYPDRGIPLPHAVTRGQCVDNLAGLKDSLLALKGGVSPGTGGMRNEYLICLAEVWEGADMMLLEHFGMRYLTGQLPPWWYRVWLSVTTVPLFKDSGGIRPVGVEPSLVRNYHKEVNRVNRPAMATFFEPQQLALSVGGAAKLVNSVRMLCEANPDFICVKGDVKNAFNSASRAEILRVLEGEESLRHLVWHAALTLSSPSALESGGKVWGEAAEGVIQGDPESGSYFCVAWHPHIRVLDRELAAVGGAVKAGMDDIFVIGPPDVLFPAMERFWQAVAETCLLKLESTKTQVFTWSGQLPWNAPAEYPRAGTVVDGEFLPGFLCYGIPVGTPGYVRHHLAAKVQQVGREVTEIVNVLEGEGQAIWTIARASTAMKLDYHLSLCYPTDMEDAAKYLDGVLWNMLEKAAAMSIPRVDEGRGLEHCPSLPVRRLQHKSYQDWMVRMPVRLGGMGLRSVADTSLAAYLGGLEQALPHFLGEEGLCPQLQPVLGDTDSPATRWRGLTTSGCRTGEEMVWAWQTLKREAEESCAFLNTDMADLLDVAAEGAGHGSTDGSTRRKVTTLLEDMRAATLVKALEEHPDQSARPVWVHPQLDKLSQGWILSLPGHNGFSQAEFSETVARLLCLPSPCCQTKLGQPLHQHGLLVDPFGDNILSVTNIPGDHCRTRHDSIKMVINSFCLTSNIRADCEVYGLFRDLIPIEALGEEELQRGRVRQGLLPDFKLELPTTEGDHEVKLAELKVIGAVESWYPRSGPSARRCRGVDKRSSRLAGEYRRPLIKLDHKYHGTPSGQIGPLQRRLESFGTLQGLVVGSFQEASQDLHSLLECLTDAKLRARGLARGREGGDWERGIILNEFRRELSLVAAKAVSSCILGKASKLGHGQRQAARRRAWAKQESERRDASMRAHWMANIHGRGLHRHGKFAIPW